MLTASLPSSCLKMPSRKCFCKNGRSFITKVIKLSLMTYDTSKQGFSGTQNPFLKSNLGSEHSDRRAIGCLQKPFLKSNFEYEHSDWQAIGCFWHVIYQNIGFQGRRIQIWRQILDQCTLTGVLQAVSQFMGSTWLFLACYISEYRFLGVWKPLNHYENISIVFAIKKQGYKMYHTS